MEEVIRQQRIYEQQDTAAHDLIASKVDIHFDSPSTGAYKTFKISFKDLKRSSKHLGLCLR